MLLPPIPQNKLILLLQQMSAELLERLRLFVDSPYFNTYKRISQLVHYLCDLAPDWQAEKYEDSLVFAYIYGKEVPFDKKRFADLRSDTFKLVEQFLAQEALEVDNITYHRGLFQYYYRLDNLNNYQQLIKKMELHLQKEKQPSAQFYYHQFLLEESKWGINTKYSQREKREKSVLAMQAQAQQVCDAFDVFYFIRKLEMSLVQLNMEGVVKTHFSYHLLDEILAYIDTQAQLQSNPLLYAYYLAVRMFRKEEHDSYFLLKDFLTCSSDKLPIWDVRNLSNALLNYCIKRVSASKDWEKERMEITFLQVEKGLVYNDSGHIAGPVFINVLTVALKISRERASNFIRDNLSKLPTDIQDNMKIYSEALIAFEEKQFKEVVRLLNLRAITDDIYLEIRAQRLLIKAYFEAEDPYIENILNTFKSYIHYSQVIPLEQKNANDNFRKLLMQIINALSPAKKEQLKLKISHTVELVEREWLISQLQH